MWFGHRHRGHPEDTGGGFSERGEDFYPAIREDIQLATREDFFMAMDTTACDWASCSLRGSMRVKYFQAWCSAWQVAADPAEGLL